MRIGPLLVIGLLQLLVVNSQSCQIYNITNNAFCLVRTDYPVFVEAGSTQNAIGKLLLDALNVSSSSFGESTDSELLDQIAKGLPLQCVASYTAFICSLFIPGT
jgi:hypothetical protein